MEAKDYVSAIRAYGLTQAQVAERTGIPQPTISKIERGEVADVMSKNYRALQLCLDDLKRRPALAIPTHIAINTVASAPQVVA